MRTTSFLSFKLLTVLTTLTFGLGGCAMNAHWEYQGEYGVDNWGSLDSKYALCEKGMNQSPVDINQTIDARLTALMLNFSKPATEIINNGHTVQLNFPKGSGFTIKGQKFELKQAHFHSPSENTVDGKSYPLEVHFVHQNDQGQLAVVAVLFDEGSDNRGLSKLLQQLPMQKGERYQLSNEVYPRFMMPRHMGYYRFNGSLTTPPCSEGVLWLVLKRPVKASKAQIQALRDAINHANNRPVQPINARVILK